MGLYSLVQDRFSPLFPVWGLPLNAGQSKLVGKTLEKENIQFT
jgi:hypothetical protein